MKFYRYILFPLIWGLFFAFFRGMPDFLLSDLAVGFLWGACGGLLLIGLSDILVGYYKKNASEEDFGVTHQRNLVVFFGYETAFDFCYEAIDQLKKTKITSEDRLNGFFKATTDWTFRRNECEIIIQLNPLTETSTEINIKVSPINKMAVLDMGNNLMIIEALEKFFKDKNDFYQDHLLPEKTQIPINFGETKNKVSR